MIRIFPGTPTRNIKEHPVKLSTIDQSEVILKVLPLTTNCSSNETSVVRINILHKTLSELYDYRDKIVKYLVENDIDGAKFVKLINDDKDKLIQNLKKYLNTKSTEGM